MGFHRFRMTGLCLLFAAAPAYGQTAGLARLGALLQGTAVKTVGEGRVRWLPGTLGYLQAGSDSVTAAGFGRKVDPVTGVATPLVAPAVLTQLRAEYQRAAGTALPDARLKALRVEGTGARLSFDADGSHYVFSADSGRLTRLRLPEKTGPLDLATTQAGKFSPDLRRYAFIRDYDHLWVRDAATGVEERLVVGTGEDNLIGFLDAGPWFVWSPDGTKIAYFKADQRRLYPYPLMRDLDRKATVEYLRYPFTTDPNPVLELHVIDVATKRDVLVATGTEEEPFLREIAWFPDGREVVFQIVNQWESRLRLMAADPETGKTRTLLVDADPAYLDPIHNFRVLMDGQRFLWSSEQSGWRHLYLYDRQGRLLKQLTTGPLATGEVQAVDERKGVVYLPGITHLGLERHLFAVRLDGTGMIQVTQEPGWHDVSIDPAMRAFLDRFSSLAAPPSAVMRTIDGRSLRVMASSDTTALHELGVAPPELVTVKGADGVTDLQGLLFKPADFDPGKKYPMIVSIYGGPHTKAIRNRYETNDFRAAIAQLGFLVFEVDGRGTMDRGKAFQTGSYLKMGQVDVDDQAAAVRQLRNRPYLDSTRVGVTGISHGGYLTLMMVLRYPEVYQVGVAGAPITDLANGPRQYIGRIMRTPAANPDGYAKGNPIPLARTLKGRLMIYYGTDDHNAVNVNTMQFLRALIDAGRPVDVAVYPHGSHVLEGADSIHGIKTMVSYFLEHLRPDGWEGNRNALWQ